MSKCITNPGNLFPWLGGKRLLAKKIIGEMPEHIAYVEVFAGGASVFFRKTPSAVEVLNDINREIITCYRVAQNHYDELYRVMQNMLVSRDEFTRIKQIPPETLTDVQRAARFLYLQKNCFGGKYTGSVYGVSKTEKPRFNSTSLKETLDKASKRLSRVNIECLDYQKLIPRYDTEKTLFYVDPPYYNMENYYGKDIFSKDDFETLQGILSVIKGKFILSINDVPPIRELFNNFRLKEVETKYSVNSKQNKAVGELLIMNY